jgi:hypothetical protein
LFASHTLLLTASEERVTVGKRRGAVRAKSLQGPGLSAGSGELSSEDEGLRYKIKGDARSERAKKTRPGETFPGAPGGSNPEACKSCAGIGNNGGSGLEAMARVLGSRDS